MNALRKLTTLVAIVLALYLLASWATASVAARKWFLQKEISNTGSEIERLQSAKDALLSTDTDTGFPRDLIWLAADRSDAELQLQDQLTALAAENQLDLVAFGPGAIRRETTQNILSFEVETEGDLAATYRFLAALESTPQKIAIGTLRLRPSAYVSVPTEDVKIYLHTTAWVFWKSNE